MSKMTTTKKARLGIVPASPARRNLTPVEAMELQEMQRMVNFKNFEASQLKGNTAMLNTSDESGRGTRMAQEAYDVAKLLENAKNGWVAQKLLDCGYEANTKCSVNLSTGEILPENEPQNS
jgi:hypothetical protein